MEQYGFFDHIYESLPAEFTAVFEIARILDDPDSALGAKLRPALHLATQSSGTPEKDVEAYSRFLPTGEEYEAELIRNPQDISRIYKSQFALPDYLFDQKLLERTLWMPVAKQTLLLPIEDPGSFGFDSSKQKVYVLLDTSSSMKEHHRIHLAKAVLYFFLTRNKKEMGYVWLRTFDDTISDPIAASDEASFNAMIRFLLRIHNLGNGTALQQALHAAITDIHESDNLAGSEILVITDGAVHLDEERLRSQLLDTIQIHTIKIGDVHIFPSDREVEDIIDSNSHDRILHDLKIQERELARALNSAQGQLRRHELDQSIHAVQSGISERRNMLAEAIRSNYGHELERLSALYIHVQDLNDKVFTATPESVAALHQLTDQLTNSDELLTPELIKRLVILHDHVDFLIKYESNLLLSTELNGLDQRLRSILSEAIEAHPEGSSLQGQPHPSHGSIPIPIGEEDQRDLNFLLHADSSNSTMKWREMVRLIIDRISAIVRTNKQKYRS